MAFLGWVLFGLVSSGALVWLCHRLDKDREILGTGLILLGGWYLLFGGLDMDLKFEHVETTVYDSALVKSRYRRVRA